MSPRISQRQARRLRKQVEQLTAILRGQRNLWARDYPSGTQIDTVTVRSEEWHIVMTARTLGHACVVVPGDDSTLRVYALPNPEIPVL